MAVLVYTLAIFVSATLLFLIQPMFARFVVPMLGGSPSVWNTALVFYQAVLLGGYAYAHFASKRWGVRTHAKIHAAILLLPFAVLPFGVRSLGATPTEGTPVFWLLLTLALSVGLPFFVVSAGSPLIQRWFSQLDHPNAADPYFLYAASNVGSMAALILYPFIIEPALTLRQQTVVWTVGYGLMVVLYLAAALLMLKSPVKEQAAEEATPRPASNRIWRWIGLAFVPSALMMGVTTVLTTDVASIPLMWAGPLALYLLTFILAFAKRKLVPVRFLSYLVPVVLVFALVTIGGPILRPTWLVGGIGILAFFAAALWCHGALAEDRPDASHLTEFFLWVSVGGVLGGIFCGLLAPVLFPTILEYPIAIILCLALLPPLFRGPAKVPVWALWAAPAVVFGVAYAFFRVVPEGHALFTGVYGWEALALPAVLVLALAFRPAIMAAGAAAMLLAAFLFGPVLQGTIYSHRDFFGAIRVKDVPYWQQRHFYHGTTLHGTQSLDPAKELEPQAYYHRKGPMGDFWKSKTFPADARIAVVGMGVASIAAYAKPGQDWTYYEIDPAVAKVATDPKLFTYVAKSPAPHRVVLGDARASLSRTDRQYDVIVQAAYSSATVPVHLLTKEAFQVYVDRLRPGGVIMMHIANRYLDLDPVVAKAVEDLGLVARTRGVYAFTPEMWKDGMTPTQWVAIARKEEDLGALMTDPNWTPLRTNPNQRLWTDDYSSVVAALRIRG